ncbi:CoA transferase [Pueribacillus theae]|nr:CaiB/BaiF CoA-transferase family protein [Pueribacillus theae]
MGFLSPYLILDMTNEKGLLAGKILADLGAKVIQLEPIQGSSARNIGPFVNDGAERGKSLFWEAYACNKRGITCNIDTKKGLDLFKKLCEKADFLIESEEPGSMARRGLSFEDLHQINPHLIHVSITPFGSDGPKANYADSDLILWAAGGALYPNLQDDRPPVRVTLPQSYMHAAADAAVGALIAHFSRLKSGLGQHVDISAQRSVAQNTLSRILSASVGDFEYEKNSIYSLSAASNKKIFDKDGGGSKTAQTKWKVKDGYVEMNLSMGPSSGRLTNNLMKWLAEEEALEEKYTNLDWRKVPELIRNKELGWDEVDYIYEKIASFLKHFSKNELMEIAVTKKVPMAPVQSFKDLAENKHLNARGFWIDCQSEDRQLRMPGRFARTSVDGFEFNRLAPKLGEHNFEVYGEIIGLKSDEVEELMNQGVI